MKAKEEKRSKAGDELIEAEKDLKWKLGFGKNHFLYKMQLARVNDLRKRLGMPEKT
ncbi:hypothetical protein HYS94_01610 [Candidatus Daviesbacteria bacterium]|nr:hypothetical protein [Candidatus Daviesbacteria bacterium]